MGRAASGNAGCCVYFSVERFIDKIFVKAWSHLGDKSMAEVNEFALTAIPRLKARHSLISLVGFDNESERLKQLFNKDHQRRRRTRAGLSFSYL